jgi:RNA polymerase sigma-70 factor, ECF subfamily
MTDDALPSEAPIRAACEAGDLSAAATLVLGLYGRDVLGFLIVRLHGLDRGEEAFAMFAEDLWRGLPRFAWRCSMRGWVYSLARNAANRLVRSPQARPRNNLPLSTESRFQEVVQELRTVTAAYLRTEAKDRARTLRETLEPDDQLLISLHVERKLAWREIAIALHDQADPLEGEALERESARLRKRFERLKLELKRLAKEQGLID